MSGHSKWHSIKYKKGIADAKRGKIFTKHAKLITIATRDSGGDVEMNPALRTAVANAKADNMPNTNIEKAIKKGTGEDKDGAVFSEVMYEGFGPANTVFYVQVITDNKNRSVASVKNIFSKNGGNLGEAGTVGWMFEKKGVVLVEDGGDEEAAELAIIDSGAEDFTLEDDVFEILTDPIDLMKVRDNLVEAGLAVKNAEISYIPKNTVLIDDLADAEKIVRLIDALEDDDDVSRVYGNHEFSDDVMTKFDEISHQSA